MPIETTRTATVPAPRDVVWATLGGPSRRRAT